MARKDSTKSSVMTAKTDRGPSMSLPSIPAHIIDVPTQRRFVVSFFVLIQAYKLYDLVELTTAHTTMQLTFVIKYLLLDGLFVSALPVLNLPLLTFRWRTVLLQILLLCFLTVLLCSLTPLITNGAGLPFMAPLYAVWKILFGKEITILGNSVNPSDVYDTASHFRGKHTIKFLPDSSAKLNPFNERFCLLDSPVHIPIRFNASEVAFVQVEHTAFDNTVTLRNYTGLELTLWTRDAPHVVQNPLYTADAALFFLDLPVASPGLYRLRLVFDPKRYGLKVYKSEVYVPLCPSVKLSAVRWQNKCINTKDDMTVEVSGVAPFTIHYTHSVNGKPERMTKVVKRPELGGSGLQWAQPEALVVPLALPVTTPGEHLVALTQLVDGFGNTFDFNPRLRDPEIYYAFTARNVPMVRLVDPLPGLPLLEGGEKKLAVDVSGGFQHGDAPYTVDLSFISEDPLLSYNFTQEFSSVNTLVVAKAGRYRINRAHTQYCGAQASPAEVVVALVRRPTVEISATPIVDRCVGVTGYTFAFALTGSGPFEVDYKVFKVSRGVKVPVSFQTIKAQSDTHVVDYQPKQAGDYVIQFSALRDRLYRESEVLDEDTHTYETSFTKQSRAFFERKHQEVCHNQTAAVTVKLEGSPPFTLAYDIVNPKGQRKAHTRTGITHNAFEIVTPLLAQSGEYKVVLSDAKDKSGCPVLFSGEARIHVKPPVATLAFTARTLTLVEGSEVSLPLNVEGNLDISYTRNGDHHRLTGSRLIVRDQGTYQLVSYKQNGCDGAVSSLSVVVGFYPQPDMRVNPGEGLSQEFANHWSLLPFCHDQQDSFTVSLVGSGPFTIVYDLIYPSGVIEALTQVVTGSTYTFAVETGIHGSYEYRFNAVYDQLYTKHAFNAVKPVFSRQSVFYTVNAVPSALLGGKVQRYLTCQGNIGTPELLTPVPLTLQGAAPFNVTLRIASKTGDSFLYLTQVQESNQMYAIYNGLAIGVHTVTVELVVDANGCTATAFSEFNAVTITVTEVPTIERISPKVDYCVGDYVSYQLFGAAPFTLFYTFADVARRADVSSSFTRLAAKPGVLTVEAIADSSLSCLVNFTRPGFESEFDALRVTVHPLPSVIVSQGEYVVEDIYEGDQAEVLFTFEGTPPFTLTYTRTVEANRKLRQTRTVETTVVTDIWTHEHTIRTSLQGTYEAIEVADAHCLARNH